MHNATDRQIEPTFFSAMISKDILRNVSETGHASDDHTSLSMAESVARGLIGYAERDAAFRASLLALGSSFSPPHTHVAPYFSNNQIGLVVPSDREGAIQRAAWLNRGIREGWLPEASAARALLATWRATQTQEEPKMVVIGHILGVIPPVGAGNIKRKRKLTLIVRENLVEEDAGGFVQTSARLSAEVIARTAQLSGGRWGELEPETAEWLFGERIVTHFSADAETMGTIARDVRELGIIHAKEVDDDNRIAALAISPMANGEYLGLHYNLRAMCGR